MLGEPFGRSVETSPAARVKRLLHEERRNNIIGKKKEEPEGPAGGHE